MVRHAADLGEMRAVADLLGHSPDMLMRAFAHALPESVRRVAGQGGHAPRRFVRLRRAIRRRYRALSAWQSHSLVQPVGRVECRVGQIDAPSSGGASAQTKHRRMRYHAVFGPGSALRIARSLALGGSCEAHFDKLAEVLTRGPQWAGVAACTG
jgi:hypothetical protein